MKKNLKYLSLLAVAAAFVTVGCHKGSDDNMSDYMEGSIDYDFPAYSLVGKSYKVRSGGIIAPTSGVTYYWTSSFTKDTVMGQVDKVVEATYTIPDSLATFNVIQHAMADGYYQTTATKFCTSVKPYIGGSLTGVTAPADSILDPRDGQFYYTTEAGSLVWFAENLNYQGAGAAYSSADDAGIVFGRLYTWKDATGGESGSGLGGGPQGVCPEGWSIPTNEDWEDLAEALGGRHYDFKDNWLGLGEMVMVDGSFNGENFWPYSARVTPKAKFGWDALATGYCVNNYHNYYGLFSNAYFWSSTESDGDNAYYRYIYYDLPNFPFGYTPKDEMGASVRCVKLK